MRVKGKCAHCGSDQLYLDFEKDGKQIIACLTCGWRDYDPALPRLNHGNHESGGHSKSGGERL